MARWPLLGGAYMAQSVIANAQRCVNLYPERNQQDAPVPVTHYAAPGTLSVSVGLGVGRGMITASDGVWYGVSGGSVWWRDGTGVVTVLGTIPVLDTPVRFVDNSIQLCVLDGTEGGAWLITFSDKTFAQLTDATETFTSATMGAYLDTFSIFNIPDTKQFIISEPNSFTFDNDVGSKTAAPDKLSGLVTVHRELWLIGVRTTEIWTTVANEDFPFQIIPGAFVEYGCAAPYSIATADISVFWLAQNEEGQAMVLRGRGYEALRISTHALENEMQGYATLTDAQAYTYQENGHIFYVLNFPTADKTWVYDESTTMWHERAWMDSDGHLHRQRVCSVVTAYGTRYGQDWETGELYEVSSRHYTDNGSPMVRVRGFPHLPTMEVNGKKVSLEGKRIKYHKFSLDIEVGTTPETSIPQSESNERRLLAQEATGLILTDPSIIGDLIAQETDDLVLTDPDDFTIARDTVATDYAEYALLLDTVPGGVPGPRVMLRWSNTRGSSWQGTLTQSLGSSGEYATLPSFWRLGTARDRIWEVSWVATAPVALNGAWVELSVMKS